MPKIEITALLWPQVIDGRRYERHYGDVVEASDADAARLIRAGAAKTTRRAITVADQKDTAKTSDEPTSGIDEDQVSTVITPVETETQKAEREAELEAITDTAETYQDTYELLPVAEVAIPMPANSAKTELWQQFAIAAGLPEETARGMNRSQLRALFD